MDTSWFVNPQWVLFLPKICEPDVGLLAEGAVDGWKNND